MSLFSPQDIHHHLNHSTRYIAGFLRQCICMFQFIPGNGSFYFVCIESIFNTAVALQYMSYGTINVALIMKICLNAFLICLPRFHLTMHIFIFSFYRICCQLSLSKHLFRDHKKITLHYISGALVVL